MEEEPEGLNYLLKVYEGALGGSSSGDPSLFWMAFICPLSGRTVEHKGTEVGVCVHANLDSIICFYNC